MSRFTRYSRVSPLALCLEAERCAWRSAAGVGLTCLLLAGAALVLPAPGRIAGEGGEACFTGVLVSEVEPDGHPLPLRDHALPPPERRPAELPPVAVPQTQVSLLPPSECELTSELPEVEPGDSPLELELPERLDAAAERPHRVAAATPVAAAAADAGELVAASYRYTPHPPYPPSLLQRRVQGEVGLRIVLDAEGVPQQVEVCAPSGYAAFDRSAREWVLAHWRFHPARRKGVAVASVVRARVDFVLQ